MKGGKRGQKKPRQSCSGTAHLSHASCQSSNSVRRIHPIEIEQDDLQKRERTDEMVSATEESPRVHRLHQIRSAGIGSLYFCAHGCRESQSSRSISLLSFEPSPPFSLFSSCRAVQNGPKAHFRQRACGFSVEFVGPFYHAEPPHVSVVERAQRVKACPSPSKTCGISSKVNTERAGLGSPAPSERQGDPCFRFSQRRPIRVKWTNQLSRVGFSGSSLWRIYLLYHRHKRQI